MAGGWRSVLLTPNALGKDGVSALSREMARALPGPAIILSLHDTTVPAEQSPVGVAVRGAGGRRLTFVLEAMRLATEISRETVVACSHLHLGPIAKLLTLIGRTARPTVVLCGIEAWVPLRLLERWGLASSEVTAISQHTVDRFKAANPEWQSVNISVCHPGLPVTREPADRPSSIALIVARMSAAERYKGHDALLDAWPQVLARHPDAVLAIAGDGDDRPRLEAKARSLHIEGSVTFTGRIPDDALADLYARCRFFVMPSRDEGFGLVFLEAMRAGKPCIGGAGAAAEIIDHDVTGLVIDPASRDQLVSAMLRLYGDQALCARLGAAGRERFLSTFTDRHFQARFAASVA